MPLAGRYGPPPMPPPEPGPMPRPSPSPRPVPVPVPAPPPRPGPRLSASRVVSIRTPIRFRESAGADDDRRDDHRQRLRVEAAPAARRSPAESEARRSGLLSSPSSLTKRFRAPALSARVRRLRHRHPAREWRETPAASGPAGPAVPSVVAAGDADPRRDEHEPRAIRPRWSVLESARGTQLRPPAASQTCENIARPRGASAPARCEGPHRTARACADRRARRRRLPATPAARAISRAE